ncbi:MAG: phosphatase PAP2 family protein [Bergeyella sp.]|nr:phosphatase PAP2 family protein [Bergeyella sp.]
MVTDNFKKIRLSLLYFPVVLLSFVILFLYEYDALSTGSYVQIQKNTFLFLNSKLSQYPVLEYNLTQLGDALVILSLLSVFIVYIPAIWENLLSALLVSTVCSVVLKELFAVPRPAAVFDHNSFVIIGKTLTGHNSLPSGHSITISTILTVVLFAFMPRKLIYKIMWYSVVFVVGFILVSTRVGVGAHYPLDITIGSIIGYLSGVLGIFINQKHKLCAWVNNKKYYPVFIVLFVIGIVLTLNRITNENLVIFYISLAGLMISLYIIARKYVEE